MKPLFDVQMRWDGNLRLVAYFCYSLYKLEFHSNVISLPLFQKIPIVAGDIEISLRRQVRFPIDSYSILGELYIKCKIIFKSNGLLSACLLTGWFNIDAVRASVCLLRL